LFERHKGGFAAELQYSISFALGDHSSIDHLKAGCNVDTCGWQRVVILLELSIRKTPEDVENRKREE